jgi:uncharacterized membrane protein YidH (DUF202 family)
MATSPYSGAPVQAMNEILTGISDIIASLCLICGILIMVGAFYQWLQRRKNPSAITLTRVITLLIVGIALVCVQFVPKAVI